MYKHFKGCGVRITIFSPEGRVHSWKKELDSREYGDSTIMQESATLEQLLDVPLRLSNFSQAPPNSPQFAYAAQNFDNAATFSEPPVVVSNQLHQQDFIMDIANLLITPDQTTESETRATVLPYMTKIGRKRDVAF
ncbi:hypothetical protein HK100_003638, partial [Physocladia obscura]